MTGCVADHGCITCGDVAIPMRVVRIDDRRSLALCAGADGRRESVEIALVEPVRAGEWLLVHAGTALARAGEHEAEATGQGGAARQGGATDNAGSAGETERALA
jgi:hydrogenase assembly chaperone HypC/HupF